MHRALLYHTLSVMPEGSKHVHRGSSRFASATVAFTQSTSTYASAILNKAPSSATASTSSTTQWSVTSLGRSYNLDGGRHSLKRAASYGRTILMIDQKRLMVCRHGGLYKRFAYAEVFQMAAVEGVSEIGIFISSLGTSMALLWITGEGRTMRFWKASDAFCFSLRDSVHQFSTAS